MGRLQWGIAAASAGLLALAGVIVIAPSALGPAAPVLRGAMQSELATSRPVLYAMAVLVALVGVVVARRDEAVGRPTHRESGPSLDGLESTVAGDDLDAQLRRVTAGDPTASEAAAEDLRDALRETALAVLQQSTAWSASEARDRLASGDWTDDPHAAAFFTANPAPVLVRLREWLDPRSAFELRIEHVIEALEDRLTLQRPVSDDPEASHPVSADIRARATRHPADPDIGTEPTDGLVSSSDRVVETVTLTGRDSSSEVVGPRGFGLGAALVAAAFGLLTGTTAPFLLGLFAVGYAVSKHVADAPFPTVELTRTVGSDSPVPGDLVEVELRLENVGDRAMADLRVVDAPPAPLRVVEGSPTLFTSLQPGGTDTVSYTIRAKRGTFTFGETELITRDLTGTRERRGAISVPARITGATLLDELPLLEQTSKRIGTVKTDHGGSGIEFYGTREYREGDPLNRVDWNQLAKTGALTTVQFREQRAPTVSIVLDQRDEARVAPTAAELDGVDLSVYAAEQAFLKLLEIGTDVGLITFGERLTDIEPAGGPTQRALVQSRLRAATDRYAAALGETGVDSDSAVLQRLSPTADSLGYHVPRNAQVIVLSSATDPFAADACRRLTALGHQVTLLSPAVVGDETVGSRHARLERASRLDAARETGVRVIDWHPGEALQLALARAIDQHG